MRQWLVRPNLMCQRHRLGEHLETHMFQGSMRGNISLQGYYDNHLFFGPQFLLQRHEELLPYMGEPHNSIITADTIREATKPFPEPPKRYSRLQYPDVEISTDMIKKSRMDLVSRCHTCRSLHLEAKRSGKRYKYRVQAGV